MATQTVNGDAPRLRGAALAFVGRAGGLKPLGPTGQDFSLSGSVRITVMAGVSGSQAQDDEPGVKINVGRV